MRLSYAQEEHIRHALKAVLSSIEKENPDNTFDLSQDKLDELEMVLKEIKRARSLVDEAFDLLGKTKGEII